jgi:hypothetical protein
MRLDDMIMVSSGEMDGHRFGGPQHVKYPVHRACHTTSLLILTKMGAIFFPMSLVGVEISSF